MQYDRSFIEGTNFLKLKDKKFEILFNNIGQLSFERRTLNLSTFCKIIIGQQLSSKVANTIFNRFHDCLGGKINVSTIRDISFQALNKVGISSNKINYIKALGKKLEFDPNFFTKLHNSSAEISYRALTELKGVGPWTANIIQLFYFNHLNTFPYGDTTLEKVYHEIYEVELSISSSSNYKEIEWASPYKGILALYLWEYYDRGLYKGVK